MKKNRKLGNPSSQGKTSQEEKKGDDEHSYSCGTRSRPVNHEGSSFSGKKETCRRGKALLYQSRWQLGKLKRENLFFSGGEIQKRSSLAEEKKSRFFSRWEISRRGGGDP